MQMQGYKGNRKMEGGKAKGLSQEGRDRRRERGREQPVRECAQSPHNNNNKGYIVRRIK